MKLGDYRLIAELGYGGMADVHLAVASGHANTQKLVVIKQLRRLVVPDEDALGMFLDEGRLAVRLSHPNVVQTYGVGVDGDRHFLVMEFLDGMALNAISRQLRSRGGLPLAMHLRVLADMLAGLDYAHNVEDFDGTPLGIVHRDVSPHNTFVTYDGQTKVVDFGIAKALRSSTHTSTGVIKGKISYMSPEQARAERLDRRSDVFAAGIMLWEAVTGARLWQGLADTVVLQRLLTSTPVPSPREVKPDLSDLVVRVCGRALSPRPEDRHATAAELQADVEAILAETGESRVTSREVGKFVAASFAGARAKTKALIEAQLRSSAVGARWGDGPPSRPSGELPHLELGLADTGLTPSAGRGTVLGVEATVAVGRPRGGRARRRAWATAGGLGLAAAAAAAAVLAGALRGRGGGGAVERAAAVQAPPQRPPPDVVTVRLSASPREAKLFLDGRPLEGNPYEGALPRDEGAHTLRVEAPGYLPKAHELSLAASAELAVDLVPKAVEGREAHEVRGAVARPAAGRPMRPSPSPSPSPSPPPPPPPPEPPTAARPNSVVLPKPPGGGKAVVIDTSDPWKQRERAQ